MARSAIDRSGLDSLLRERGDVERERQRFWNQQRAELGPAATLRASESLIAHMRSVRPDWPTAAERDDDLAHHVAWTALLDRIARALSGH